MTVDADVQTDKDNGRRADTEDKGAMFRVRRNADPDTYDNGAGGTYQVTALTQASNQQHALAACESFAGSGQCTVGTCGHFTYYYTVTHVHCDGSKGDAYEWIFANTGYSQVGEDYGLGQTDVSGDSLFVRYKPPAGAAWVLALKELGRNCGIRVSSITISCFSV